MRFLALIVVLGCAAPKPASRGTVGSDTAAVDPATPVTHDWAAFAPDDQRALSDQLDRAVTDLGLVGAAMGVATRDPKQRWTGASGLSRRETGERWTPDRSFRIGSVTKTFTAALVFLLEADGVLSLDDPIERWVPHTYPGVTLTHLLSHTSGIVSYNYVGSFDDSRPWEPRELVDWAVANEPGLRFEPGSQWEYSNTNSVLLGLALEAASGQTYPDLVADRLTGPLGLRDTYIALSGDDNPAIVDCYAEDGETNLTGTMDPSMGWAAGAGVSTPADLATWAVALYGGGVLPEDALRRMVTPITLTDGTVVEHGLGAFVETDGVDALHGHTGGIMGYQTYLYYWEADHVAVVAMSNRLETDLRALAAYGWSVPLGFPYP